MEGISTRQIELGVASLRKEIEGKRARHAELGAEIQRAERELSLLSELARIRGAEIAPDHDGALAAQSAESPGFDGSLGDAVVSVLRRRGQQMHVQELLASVRALGVSIPGRGDSANLIAHIRTHPEIVRPVRGMYGLREWGLSHSPVKVHRRRRRRKQHRTSQKG